MAGVRKSLFEKVVPLGIPVAWLQLAGDKKRFFVALLGITFAVAMMLFQFGLRSALYKQVVGPLELLDGQLVIVGANYEYFGVGKGFPQVRMHQAYGLKDVVSATGIKLGNMSFKNVDDGRARDIFVIAFDPSKNVFLSEDIQKSQGLLKRDGAILFDSLSRPQYGTVADRFLREGTLRTEISGMHAKVEGLVKIGATFAADGNVLTSLRTFSKVWPEPDGVYSVGVIKLRDGADAEAAAKTLKKILPDDVSVLTKQQFIENEKNYWAERTPIGFVIGASMAVAIFVGAVIVYQILYTDVTDHLSEYATLKAIGFADSFFVWIIVQESFILSIMGFVPGAALAEALYVLTRNVAGMQTYMSAAGVTLVFGLSLSMCLIAGLLATRKLRKANPADIF